MQMKGKYRQARFEEEDGRRKCNILMHSLEHPHHIWASQSRKAWNWSYAQWYTRVTGLLEKLSPV